MDPITKIGEPQCQALNLFDSVRCTEQATVSNGLFCKFHGKQCYGLYKGYKRRNARLDALMRQTPEFLRNSKIPLSNQSFGDIVSEAELHEIRTFLFAQYVLLCKIIKARRLHHDHFYSLELDYGHKVYLDKLVNQRHSVLRALEKLERRTTKVLYEKEAWFDWAREAQIQEEESREKEQKKVKMEAAMFRRHWQETQARLRALRQKEAEQRQAAYLEEAWKERMTLDAEADDDGWDPIEDMVGEERAKFIDLIRHFLWMKEPSATRADAMASAESATTLSKDAGPVIDSGADNASRKESEDPAAVADGNGPKKKKGKKGRKKPDTQSSRGGNSRETGQLPVADDISSGTIESRDDIRKRLREGVTKDYDSVNGPMVVGTLQNPFERLDRTAPVPEDEVEQLIKDIQEIKLLLFCRQLLSHASLLPIALKASSVEELLAHPELADSDIRDLCLKLEKPSLQALRDACADLVRGDEPAVEIIDPEKDEREETTAEILRKSLQYRKVQNFSLQRIGPIYPRQKPPKQQKMKITICGKTIWNHASQEAMARDGWLQFSILAKDCSFKEAIHLCRNWNEFFDLNMLSVWHFFPTSRWAAWQGDMLTSELLQLGFIPFYTVFEAMKRTTHNQIGGRSQLRRQHHLVESRNVLCGYMKKNDPVTKRFIHYVLMRKCDVQILVRDGKTGKIVTAPDVDELWVSRMKSGFGRASRREWDVEDEIGPLFFQTAHLLCNWNFSFDEYYEVYIWHFVPGQPHVELMGLTMNMMLKARRVRTLKGKWHHLKSFLQSLVQEQGSKRVRLAKPGETAQTLWDVHTSPDTQIAFSSSRMRGIVTTSDDLPPGMGMHALYNDADVAEDAILFPEEADPSQDSGIFEEFTNPLYLFESGGITSTILNHEAERFDALLLKDLEGVDDSGTDDDLAKRIGQRPKSEYQPGADGFIYSAPPVWQEAYDVIVNQSRTLEQTELLKRIDFFSQKLNSSTSEVIARAKPMEIMERDRSYVFKETLHLGDLEPNGREKYAESMKLITGIQKHAPSSSTADWAWFCMRIIDWLDLKIYYDTYVTVPQAPWPHPYVAQDIVQAFVTIALFFPENRLAAFVQDYLRSDEGKAHASSPLFNPSERAAKRPNTRTRASNPQRPKSFWSEWDDLLKQEAHFSEVFPMDWSLTVRPIIAQLYRSGIITPASLQPDPQVVGGYVTAACEPHRPDELDLFVRYSWGGHKKYPKEYCTPQDWPAALPAARRFAAARGPSARFAVLRLWSAPHFYPLMMGLENQRGTSFLDSGGRSWSFRFVPKDMPDSEFSMHHTVAQRLRYVFEAHPEAANHVVHRGDLLLIMAEDEDELLRLSTMFVFVVQTKPWLREVDLWKSFINVELAFLEELDEFWLD